MSQFQSAANSDLPRVLAKSMHEHWGVFLAEGIILILLGMAAIAVPVIAGLTASIFLGWIFLLAGILGLVATFRARSAPGFGWALFSAILALVAGVILLWNPLRGLVTLTYVLILFFIIDGVSIIAMAISHRRELSGKWEWMLVNGVIDLFLAGIIISGLPGTLAWALGLLVGIDMVYGGVALIVMALAARKSAASII